MYFAAHPLAASIQARSNPAPAVYLAGAGIAALIGYYFYTKSSAEGTIEDIESDPDAPVDIAVEGESISVEDQQLQDFDDAPAAQDAGSGESSGGRRKKKEPHGKKAHGHKGHAHGHKGHGHKSHGKHQGQKQGPKLQPAPSTGAIKFKPSTPQVRGQVGPSSRISV